MKKKECIEIKLFYINAFDLFCEPQWRNKTTIDADNNNHFHGFSVSKDRHEHDCRVVIWR